MKHIDTFIWITGVGVSMAMFIVDSVIPAHKIFFELRKHIKNFSISDYNVRAIRKTPTLFFEQSDSPEVRRLKENYLKLLDVSDKKMWKCFWVMLLAITATMVNSICFERN